MFRPRAARAVIVMAAALGATGCTPSFASLDLAGCNPVPLREEGGLVLIDVTVRDTPISVIVDTGSALSLTLRAEELARSGAAFDGATRTFRDARGNLLTARGALLPEVRVGAAVFREVRAWESIHAADWSPPVDAGHIGRALLLATRVTVDVPRQTLHLDGPSCPAPPGEPLALGVSGHGLTTQATDPRGHTLTLAWDTAATGSVLRDASGGGESVPLVIAPGLEASFAPLDLPGLPVDGLVGLDVLRHHAVTFDPRAKTLRLLR